MKIPVAFITDEKFVMATGVAIYSLDCNRNQDTEYDVFVVMAECSAEAEQEIRKVENEHIHINIVRASLEEYQGIKQLSHISRACLLKFNLCDYINAYDKLIYLDGDIYVRGDLSKLYMHELGDSYLAGVPSLDMVFDDRKLINAGVILFDAKKMRDTHMSEILVKTRRELGDRGSMDQQTFNMVMKDKISFLPYEYNCIPNKIIGLEKRAYPIEKLNKLYGTNAASNQELVDSAVIIHYATGGKPWEYSYIKCSDEWYACFSRSPYNYIKLIRKNKFQTHLAGIRKQFKRNGIKGLLKRVIWYKNTLSGKNEYKSWG